MTFDPDPLPRTVTFGVVVALIAVPWFLIWWVFQ